MLKARNEDQSMINKSDLLVEEEIEMKKNHCCIRLQKQCREQK